MTAPDRLLAIQAKLERGEFPSRGECEWMIREITRMRPVVEDVLSDPYLRSRSVGRLRRVFVDAYRSPADGSPD